MTAAHPAFTPVAETKTAALCRVLDAVPKGYHHFAAGTCPAVKLEKLARKFHELYGIGCSPAQRLTRKQHGLANAVLVLYWPVASAPVASGPETGLATDVATDQSPDQSPDPARDAALAGRLPEPSVSWLLLVTEGAGPVHEQEQLQSVLGKPRLIWLGYELVRQSSRGRASWTWRRTKAEMADLYALLTAQLRRRQMSAVAQTLARISRQPGFSGVRQQSWDLCQFAFREGYAKPLPFLFHVQKLSHGRPLRVSGA